MKYLLKKNGLYYRPNSCGYTGILASAGIFEEEYALRHSRGAHSEVEAVPVSDIPECNIHELYAQIENANSIIKAIKESKI